MKKIISLSLVLIIMIICIASSAYAAISFKVTLTTTKSEYKNGDEFVVEVNIANLKTDEGIITFSSRLEYDKDNLTLVSMQGKNGWESPSEETNGYNPQTGKIVITRSGLSKQDETIFTIAFKVTGQKASVDSIILKENSVANGTTLAKAPDATVTSIISSPSPTPSIIAPTPEQTPNPSETPDTNIVKPTKTPSPTPINKPNNNGNNNSGATNNKEDKVLPQTGINQNSTIFLILGIAISIVTFIVYISTKNKMK